MIQVGGYEPCTVTDFEVPKQFGLRQTIADTLGIGGIIRGAAHDPRDARHVRRHGRALPRRRGSSTTRTRWRSTAGASTRATASARSGCATACRAPRSSCRSISASRTARSTTSRPASTTWRSTCASSATAKTSIRACAARRVGRGSGRSNRVRYEVLKHFGYFVTESSEHFAEYVPWFMRHDRPTRALQHPARRVLRRLRADSRVRAGAGRARPRRADAGRALERVRGDDHPRIETGKPRVIYGNVANAGLIDDLPGRLHRRGAVPRRRHRRPSGGGARLPGAARRPDPHVPQCVELTVRAVLDGRPDYVRAAAMLDPNAGAS